MPDSNSTRHEREANGTGYDEIESSISCVLTRFHLRSAWSLPGFYITYRAVRRQARTSGGLLATVFLIENLHTCYTLSFWSDPDAILRFNGEVRAHVSAANWSFQHIRFAATRPELWSAQLRLSAISPWNLNWPALARDVILDHLGTKREARDVA